MRIAFLDCGPLVYNFETPLVEPLGGSESGICYLGAALLGRGHEVVITKSVQECLGWDVVVVNTNVGDCLKLRGAGFGRTRVGNYKAPPQPIDEAYVRKVSAKFTSTYELIPPKEFEAGLGRLKADVAGNGGRLDEPVEWEWTLVAGWE